MPLFNVATDETQLSLCF